MHSSPSKMSGRPARAQRHRASLATRAFTAFAFLDTLPSGPTESPGSHDASVSSNVLSSPAFCQKSSSGLTSCPTVPEMTPSVDIDPTHDVSASWKESPRLPSPAGVSSSLRWHSCSSPCAACDTIHVRRLLVPLNHLEHVPGAGVRAHGSRDVDAADPEPAGPEPRANALLLGARDVLVVRQRVLDILEAAAWWQIGACVVSVNAGGTWAGSPRSRRVPSSSRINDG